jgi:flagellar protein FlaG
MDIKSVATYSTGIPSTAAKPASANQQETATTIQVYPDQELDVDRKDETSHLKKEDIENITDGLNDFMQSINTDIKFVLHQKTDTLMVQVVDMEKHKVLREAPPKELLDVLARIRDFVGALLDKKA